MNTRPVNGALIACETKKGITSWKSAENTRFSLKQSYDLKKKKKHKQTQTHKHKHKNTKQNSPSYRPRSIVSRSLSELLLNMQDRNSFRAQLKEEYATENLDFYDAVINFSANTPTDFEAFQKIYET